MKPKLALLAAAAIAVASIAACSPKEAAAPTAVAVAPKPVVTVQEIMLNAVAPASEAIWNAVSTTSDETGIHEEKPQTDDDWQKLRQNALVLAEAPNLLAMERPVMATVALHDADPTVKGAEVTGRITANRAGFAAAALSMQDVSARLLKAIDSKNVEQLVELGGELDAACEACHQAYWYPEDAKTNSAAGNVTPSAGTGG